MRIVAIADVHGSGAALARIAPIAEGADLLLIAGDLTDFGGAHEARKLLNLLDGSKGRIAIVPGNCDKRGAREYLAAEGVSADGRPVVAGDAMVIGAGGSPLRTGLTPYERHDRELGEALREALDEAYGALHMATRASLRPPLVVLTHAPPKASGADRRKEAEVGSPALREALNRIAPPLWVCGHIHESRCAAMVGRTLVLNPGSLFDGRYSFVLLERGTDGAWRAQAELLALG